MQEEEISDNSEQACQHNSPQSSKSQHSYGFDLDKFIQSLKQLKDRKPGGSIPLEEKTIFALIRTVQSSIFMKQPPLLQLRAPIMVCGDIHGQFFDLLRVFEYGGYPPSSRYLFLGDYIDRGKNGIESICLLLALKLRYPKQIYLLRGNHETQAISKVYGFYHECKFRYSTKLWKSFIACFNSLPVAATIEDRIVCMHGGISPQMTRLQDIMEIVKPTDVPDEGLLCDLLWSDPDPLLKQWGQSQRGVSFVYGSDCVNKFLKDNDLDMICRAHQVVEDGYEFCHKKKVVTVFSAPNYCGEFDNCAGILNVDRHMKCSFLILKPENRKHGLKYSKPKKPGDF